MQRARGGLGASVDEEAPDPGDEQPLDPPDAAMQAALLAFGLLAVVTLPPLDRRVQRPDRFLRVLLHLAPMRVARGGTQADLSLSGEALEVRPDRGRPLLALRPGAPQLAHVVVQHAHLADADDELDEDVEHIRGIDTRGRVAEQEAGMMGSHRWLPATVPAGRGVL